MAQFKLDSGTTYHVEQTPTGYKLYNDTMDVEVGSWNKGEVAELTGGQNSVLNVRSAKPMQPGEEPVFKTNVEHVQGAGDNPLKIKGSFTKAAGSTGNVNVLASLAEVTELSVDKAAGTFTTPDFTLTNKDGTFYKKIKTGLQETIIGVQKGETQDIIPSPGMKPVYTLDGKKSYDENLKFDREARDLAQAQAAAAATRPAPASRPYPTTKEKPEKPETKPKETGPQIASQKTIDVVSNAKKQIEDIFKTPGVAGKRHPMTLPEFVYEVPAPVPNLPADKPDLSKLHADFKESFELISKRLDAEVHYDTGRKLKKNKIYSIPQDARGKVLQNGPDDKQIINQENLDALYYNISRAKSNVVDIGKGTADAGERAAAQKMFETLSQIESQFRAAPELRSSDLKKAHGDATKIGFHPEIKGSLTAPDSASYAAALPKLTGVKNTPDLA
jgi:hypothetical protein